MQFLHDSILQRMCFSKFLDDWLQTPQADFCLHLTRVFGPDSVFLTWLEIQYLSSARPQSFKPLDVIPASSSCHQGNSERCTSQNFYDY
eukprot:764476-Hanusia_phi.AAC.5